MKAYMKKLAVILMAVTLVISGSAQPIWADTEDADKVQTEKQTDSTVQKDKDNIGGSTVEGDTEGFDSTTDKNIKEGDGNKDAVNTVPKKSVVKTAPEVAAKAAAGELNGAGTAEDPYQVATVEDLKLVVEKVNAGDAAYKKATYKLTANIDLKGSKDNQWTPIGTKDNAFAGTFIGTDYTISNLYIDDVNLENAGLFGYIASPAKLVGISVDGATVIGKANVGTIAGAAYTGTAENCTVTGKITVKGNYKVGGMFGGGYVKLSNCKVKAADGSSVTGEYLTTDFEGDNVGGLIGFRGEGATITTTDCSVSGLTVAGSRKVGGIVGSAFADNAYTGCSVNDVSLVCNAPYDYASGIAKNQLCVGGIVGIFMKGSTVGTMTNCTVSDVDFSVGDPKVAEENLPIMGIVSGGYRASSLSGASAPDGKIEIEGLKVSGTNTGANADEKFPGSVAMNGSNSVFEQGAGTAEDPYMINDIEDLMKFANSVTKVGLTYEGQHIKVADGVTLDLTDGTQIGSSSKKFMGTFDGNGVVLSDLTKTLFNGTDGATVKNIVVNSQTKALFANVYDSTIQNIKLNDVNIDSTVTTGALISGVLNGSSTIDGIEVTGSIQGKGSFTNISIGGIIGQVRTDENDVTTIKNCINKADVSGGNKTHVGGIYGSGYGNSFKGSVNVENCTNYGNVSSTSYWAGGITSASRTTIFTSCINEGKVEGANISGGIVGTAETNTKVSDSKNTGEVVAIDGGDTERQSAGGIIGRSASGGNPVSRSANTGNITAKHMAGGIIGGTWASGDPIDNCYNGGNITATGTPEGSAEVYAGGIFGYNNIGNSDVKACVNDGVVKAEKGKAYQIGYSFYYNVPNQGNQIADCYYIDEAGKIYLAGATGDSTTSTPQEDMTRTQLAEALNTAGGIENFWQPQNGSVQPDPLIPGVYDDVEKRVAVIADKDGNVIEGYTNLEDAINAVKDGQTVKLEKDISLATTLTIRGQKAFTLDINGHDLTMDASIGKVMMNVGTGNAEDIIDLTLTDTADQKGKVQSMSSKSEIAVRQYSSLVTEDVVIEFADENTDSASQALQVQGTLTVEEGTVINSTEYGIVAIGEAALVTVNDGEINAKYAAVSGNGTMSGTEIVINGGTLISTGSVGIYHPQDGKLTLNGGEITGLSGVQMCAGELNIPKDSKVKVIATGEDQRGDKGAGDGPIFDGAAISIVNRDYPGGVPTANINGGSFVAEKTDNAVLAYTWDAEAEGDKHSEWNEAGEKVDIAGGTYNTPVDEELLADGFGLNKPDQNGNYGVHQHKMTKVEAKDATCTEDGVSKTYYKCNICGKYFEDEAGDVEITDVDSLIIPANGHEYDDRGKCTVCGAVTADRAEADEVDKLIDAIGPADKVTLDSKDAIMAAKKAYNALTDEQKKLVTGLDELNAAIDAYNALLADGKNPIDKPAASDKDSESNGAKTDDTTALGLLAVMLLLSGAGIVALRRKPQ